MFNEKKDSDILLANHRSRLVKEGIIKSLMVGLIIGFAVLILSSIIWWFFGLEHFWLCIIFFAVSAGVSVPILYFAKFRPTVEQVARRVDALGLEERAITMKDYEQDSSYIAGRQRKDAMTYLRSVKNLSLKIVVSLALIVALGITTVSGLGLITVAGLTDAGYIRSGIEIIEDRNTPKPEKYKVTYEMTGEGDIIGFINQVITEGDSAEPVLAVPAEGWVFAGWSDGQGNPHRLDTPRASMTLTAVFKEMPEINEGDIYGDALNLGGDGDDNNGPPDPNAPPSPLQDDTGGGSSNYDQTKMVRDGQTHYGGATYDAARQEANGDMSEGDYTSGQKDITDGYFDNIAD